MIGIKEIASYIPKDYKDNLKQKLNYSNYKNFITQKIGVEKITFIKKNKTSLDMAEEATKSLLKKTIYLKSNNINVFFVYRYVVKSNLIQIS